MGFFFKKAPAPVAPPAFTRPAPRAKNNFIIVILDSCRYDNFMKASPRTIMRLTDGKVEKRYSYASWTAPSHYNLLMGLVPHTSPEHVFASEYYKQDFLNYNQRLEGDGIEFAKLVPHLWLPTFLRNVLGYTTHARVSLPVLNPSTPINVSFDSFQLMDKHNDMRAMLETMHFAPDRPAFYLLNVGETHYPYAPPDEDPSLWPRISGVHGVFKHLDKQIKDGKLIADEDAPRFFDQERLDQLCARQVAVVKYLDQVFEQLYDMVPKNTWIMVTADHGELFGESGYFGHGPINHPLVYEVPYLEAKIR
ncbi:MAG: sulfatase-like hydrolase/transferase [Planctomycetota bacterium]